MPTRKTLDLTNGIANMGYPSVTFSEVTEDPVYNIGDISDALFDDIDDEQHLGLVVLGYMDSTVGRNIYRQN